MNIRDIKSIKFHNVINRQEIPDKYLKADTESESPNGEYQFFGYGTEEPAMGWVFGNFVIVDKKTGIAIVQGEQSGLWTWGSFKPAEWSKDSRYLIVNVYPATHKIKVAYRSGKLILDLKQKRYVLVMLAGGFFYNNLNLNRAGKIILSKRQGEKGEPDRFIHVDRAETSVDKLKWVRLEKFDKAVRLYETGYFGNILGYVNDEINVRFKRGYTPWPYKDAGVK